ncbi:MAG: arylsulfotransferase (ASST), partial [Planctomycetes bacterium]|nr:arylsulfotransferase (ASST) [Planctomycetota bacterium]
MLAQTVGVFVNEPAVTDGYVLFSPELVHRTYLINNDGELVHAWPSDYDAANMTYMEPDGSIWRTG